MKKRDKSIASMNRTINLTFEKQQKQQIIKMTRAPSTDNIRGTTIFKPWAELEKKKDREKAAIMPKSLLEQCAEQDEIRKMGIEMTRVPSTDDRTKCDNKKNIKPTQNKKSNDKLQPKISFLGKRKHSTEPELYCEIPQSILSITSYDLLTHEKLAQVDMDFHPETTNQIQKFVQQSEIPILLITGQHGCGKSWCMRKVLKSLEFEPFYLHDICDPSIIETNIRSALLARGTKKQIVILDDVDGIGEHFVKGFIKILSKMLMPLKNETRKNVQRVHIVPNLVILTSVSQYDERVRKVIQSFGLITTKVQKNSPHIQLVTCKPLLESQILKLIAKTDIVVNITQIKNLTKSSVDCNYISSQLDMLQIETEIIEEKEGKEEKEEKENNDYSIDASSNIDIFKMCQSLLSGRHTSFEKIEKQWEKASPMVPNMIYNSFLHFITELEPGIDIAELYSAHDLFPNDPDIDGCCGLWEKETLYDSYQIMTQAGLSVLLQNTILKRGKIDMFATEEKFTMRHSRLPMDNLEIYLFMNELSHMEQYIRLNENATYKENPNYKLSTIDFGRETLDSKYYYDKLDELDQEEPKKKTNRFEVVPIADLIKRLSHVYKM
jgi:hypothetical protein